MQFSKVGLFGREDKSILIYSYEFILINLFFEFPI